MRPLPLSHVLRSLDEDGIQRVISEESQRVPEGVYLDFGARLPPHYGVDRLQLMVQSPFCIFAYWELTEDLMEQALKRFPPRDRPLFRPVLKWFEVGGSCSQFFDVGTTTHWWFGVAPEKEYEAQLCLYSEDYGLYPLLSSNVAVTPPFSLGPAPEDSQEGPETLPLLESLVSLAAIGSPDKESQARQGELAIEAVHASGAGEPEEERKPSETPGQLIQVQSPEVIIEQAGSEQPGTREGDFQADTRTRWSTTVLGDLDQRPTSPSWVVRS